MLVPEYLMVQRKDSLCYVEFIHAKWSPQNRQYVLKLFASMTPVERDRIASAPDFDTLWYGFWHNDTYRSYMREYQQARDQFNQLKAGFNLRCAVIAFSLAYILANTKAEYDEAEWGWPKGRRNINETDVTARSLQAQEIGQVSWCNYGTVLSNIRDHNVERRELFKRVHQLVKNNLFNIMLIAGK